MSQFVISNLSGPFLLYRRRCRSFLPSFFPSSFCGMLVHDRLTAEWLLGSIWKDSLATTVYASALSLVVLLVLVFARTSHARGHEIATSSFLDGHGGLAIFLARSSKLLGCAALAVFSWLSAHNDPFTGADSLRPMSLLSLTFVCQNFALLCCFELYSPRYTKHYLPWQLSQLRQKFRLPEQCIAMR